MASLNRVFLIGNLGADPEVRYTPSGQPVCNFKIATSEKWKDRNDEQQERTEWHRIVVWGKLAEVCGEHLKKGRSVHVEGKIATRSYDDKDGTKRYVTEIIAERVTFLSSTASDGSKRDGGSKERGPNEAEAYEGF